jgi:hypothetical protein
VSPKSIFGRQNYETWQIYFSYNMASLKPILMRQIRSRSILFLFIISIKKMSRRKHVLEVRHDQQEFQQMVTEIGLSLISLFSCKTGDLNENVGRFHWQCLQLQVTAHGSTSPFRIAYTTPVTGLVHAVVVTMTCHLKWN